MSQKVSTALTLKVRDHAMYYLGFRVHFLGLLGSGFRVFGFRAQGSGFRVQGSGFRVQGLGFRV